MTSRPPEEVTSAWGGPVGPSAESPGVARVSVEGRPPDALEGAGEIALRELWGPCRLGAVDEDPLHQGPRRGGRALGAVGSAGGPHSSPSLSTTRHRAPPRGRQREPGVKKVDSRDGQRPQSLSPFT